MDVSEFACYDVKFFYRGRRIHEDDEPPSNLTDNFLNMLTSGIIHPGWSIENQEIHRHSCGSNCAIEACIIIGRPYCNTVYEALSA